MGLNLKFSLLLVSALLVQIARVEGMDLAFEGKGKGNAEAARISMCHKICTEKRGFGNYVDPWDPAHQVCACWDSQEYRQNLAKHKCEKRQEILFTRQKEKFTCAQVCKSYLKDMFAETFNFVQLRDSVVCEAKMFYGTATTCFCDLKFGGDDPFASGEAQE